MEWAVSSLCNTLLAAGQIYLLKAQSATCIHDDTHEEGQLCASFFLWLVCDSARR
jgi:hypothetical protein